ncbi:addiction module protein [Nesterenkonia alkaliphila]|uniref:Addiction module protein n=1 Tax=Nesterenkonia alkaliphila TaxID=1463631 RepID=A0A7K1UHH6_9MICC|nr:addiction module protein [Nesterenkonia alkaliphila]MVT25928.1 hypothetical protein [Nesterenkonia alkaliphila]GFZ92987.1 hypothetical protein GCM10011359_22970 [Nesterenkonia alkaliphila]
MVEQGLLEKAQQLEDAEKVELAQALLNSVHPDALPLSAEEAALVTERLAAREARPDDRMSSEEVWKRIRRKYG